VPAVYVTLNPIGHSESMEVANTWTANTRSTTRDKDIERRRWLLVDVDPTRPANTSATDEEKRAAKAIAKEVVAHLRDQDWPDPVVGDSGNGLHLLWQVDLPNDAASTALIKSCLLALAQRFDTDQATVDRSVFNAARVVKCYGSLACKGENTPERPHRLSRLLHVPKRIQVVERALLESLAAERDSRKGYTAPVKAGLQITPENMEEFFAAHEVPHGPRTEYEAGYRWPLKQCPWEDEHTSGKSAGEAAVFWFPDKLVFKCLHSHCAGREWKEFRAYLEKENGVKYRFRTGAATPALPNESGELGSPDTVRVRIEELLYASRKGRDDLPPVKQAPAVVTDLVWSDLNARGSFFKDDQSWKAYLHLPKAEAGLASLPKVIPVGFDSWLHSLLDRYYGIHAAEPLSKRVISQLGIRTLAERPSAAVHELGHYNAAEGELYVCFGDDVIAVRPDSFAIVENGFKGYYFVPNRFASPVDVTALAKLASDLGTSTFGMQLSDSPLTEFLFARTPFDHLSAISPEQAKQLILCGALSLPFGDFFPEKPIFYITGDEDTGKTHTLRKIGVLLYGPKFNVTSMGDDPRDFTTALVSKYFLPIDDVTGDGGRGKARSNAKRLTQAATSGTVFERQLFTNAETVELRFKAWPWISGLNVFDRAPDFLSRLININLRGQITGHREGPGDLKRLLEKNRPLLLAEYLVRLQSMVRAAAVPELKEKKYGIKFRISDWARFLARVADAEGWLETYRDLFESQRAVRMVEVSTDSFLIPLKLWLMQTGNAGRNVDIAVLYKELRKQLQAPECDEVVVPCLNGMTASPAHMATHIRTLAKTILEPEFGFVEGEAGWDSNRNRVRTMTFAPTDDQLAAIARWRDAWTGSAPRDRIPAERGRP